ncbi:MAG TPA: pyridoxamine 5'-phosphate oxidase [Candidatus Baltobacteraceae bacterium]|nr:pyridoxamine 5'-phosphate oxidase [Candidatus Baltobacteraceae bacterium]
MNELDLAAMRRSYVKGELIEDAVMSDPIEQLRLWIAQARDAGNPEPNAMCLCTMGERYPSGRIVLLRGLDARGLTFYTSYFSRKAHDLARMPRAAAVFYWPQAERQVRVEGDVDRIPEEESEAYFASRPRGHQIGAWASEQSEAVEGREILEQRVADYEARFEGGDVPRPHSWGGYCLRPVRVEFWQGRANRMHDRLQFTRSPAGWTLARLQP